MGDVVGGMSEIDRRVRIPDDGRLAGDVRLPALEGHEIVDDPFFDTMGRLVSANPLLTFGAMGAGSLLGAATGTGLARRIGTGALGAGLGVLGAMAVARGGELVSGRGGAGTDAFVGRAAATTQASRDGRAGEQLRVMDWNVRELIGADGTFRTDDVALEAIASTVARERPDVLVLQEVSQGSMLGGYRDDIDELARQLGATDAVLVPNGIRASGKAKGQAVLTFGDARIQDARGLRHADPRGDGTLRRVHGALGPLTYLGVDLPDWLAPTYQPRTTADVLVTTAGGTDVRVLDVHLSGSSGGARPATTVGSRQLHDVVDTIDAWHGPTLVVGDFNTLAGTRHGAHERAVLGAAGLRDAYEAVGIAPDDASTRTFPTRDPRSSIDRLYASDDLHVVDARTVADEVARGASDHLPLVVDLTVE